MENYIQTAKYCVLNFFSSVGYDKILIASQIAMLSLFLLFFVTACFDTSFRKKCKFCFLYASIAILSFEFFACFLEFFAVGELFALSSDLCFYLALCLLSFVLLMGILLLQSMLVNAVKYTNKRLIGQLVAKNLATESQVYDVGRSNILSYEFSSSNPFSLTGVKRKAQNQTSLPFKDAINLTHVKTVIDKLSRYELTQDEQSEIQTLEHLCQKYSLSPPSESQRIEFNFYLLKLVKKLAKYSA